MVFIYGGGFDHGSGSRYDYDGERLAAKGVVFVNFNYRVGVFGFLAHPGLTGESANHSSGNYALLDQVAALKWVQANIGVFGGDATKVMIFGQSAGGASVNLLLVSPLAKGLFRAAISESPGGNQNLVRLADAEKTGAALGEVATLRAMPAAALMDAAKTGFNRPIIDGWMVPRSEREAYATKQANLVPLIIGNNANELGTSVATTPIKSVAAYEAYVQKRYEAGAAKVLAAYPVSSDEQAAATVATLNADSSFGLGVFDTAGEVAVVNPKIYRYYFSRHRGDGVNAPIHFEEVSYVFGHFDMPSVPAGSGVMERPDFNKTDEALRDTMMNVWVKFATTLDPNSKGAAPHAVKDPHASKFELLGSLQK
jgi:para-nitrobenzyl esterase